MKKNVLVRTTLLLVVMLFSFFGKVTAQTWHQVDISTLTASDVFAIVDLNSSSAMLNSNGSSAPTAVEVTLSADQTEIVGGVADDLKWNIGGNGTDGYIFYPNGTTATWLYCTNTNNGVKVGTGANNAFTLHEVNWLYNVGTSRYIGVYNEQDWRCYTSVNNNIRNTQIRYFKYSATAATVATPTFSPVGGTYYDVPQMVTINCATEGAVIHYTLDGVTEPDASSPVYTGPLTISATTTVKAVAILDEESSYSASATYTLPVVVENIAELRGQFADNVMYRILGEVVVTFSGLDSTNNDRFYTYVQDETGGMLIYEQNGTITSSLTKGDVISGFLGTSTTYHGMSELTPIQLGELVGHEEDRIDTLELALGEVTPSYQAQLVKVMNVTFATTGSFNDLAGNKANYYLVGSDDVVAQIRYRGNALSGTEIPTTALNLIALVYQYDDVIDLSLLGLEEYVPAPTDCENVPSMGTCTAVLDNRDMLFTGQVAVDDPLCTLHEYGFVYSTFNTMPDVDDEACTKVVVGTDIAAGTDFTYRLAGLGYDTYYVRAYATNEVGTGYSEATSILQAEPEIYTVNFLVNGYDGWTNVSVFSVPEEETIVKFPMMDDCGNLVFAGWALQPFEGQTEETPVLFTEFTPTSDTTFFAVFSSTSNVVNDEIVISRASFENVAGYGTDDQWTAVSKVAGTEITGWCDLYTNDATMQMRVNTPYGSYPYNETALPGAISSITMYAAGNGSARQWTPWLSSTPLSKENHTDGVSLGTQDLNPSSSVTWEVAAEQNATYFYIALSGGAAYVDSIVVTYTSADYLYTMLAVDTVTIDQTICEGMTYNENGFNTGEEGQHSYLLENNEYCATYYVLTLSLEQRDTIHHYVDTCDLYVLNNEEYTNSAEVDVITPAEETYGCPVVDEWHITIRHSTVAELTVDTCDFYTWNEETYIESGVYTQTFTNAEGCDSTVTLNLTIHLSDTVDIFESICEDALPYHYVNGEIDDTFEIGTPALTTTPYNLTTVNGCDSIVILHLTVNPVPESNETVENCGPYQWNDSTYAVSGDYEKVFRLATGCDSIAYLHLTINHGDYAEVMVDTCGAEFYWEVSGESYDHSDRYYFFSENANTCEDTTVLILSLHQAVTTEISAQICEGETYSQNGFNVSEEGDHQLTLQTVFGCDSIVVLHLSVGSESITNINANICVGEDYVENGFTVIAPEVGTYEYSDTLERPGTCDSIVALHLTVNALPEIEVSGEITFCEGGSTTLTASGAQSYVWTFSDSEEPIANTAEYTVTEPSMYIVTGTDANQCVSMAVVKTSENPLPEVTVSGETSFCEGDSAVLTAFGAETYSWGANDNTAELTVYESGTYTVTGTDDLGCSNTASVTIVVNELPSITISGETAFCEGGNTTLTASGAETYTWGANDNMAEFTVTEAGTYTVTGTDANGCENTASVEVTMNVLPTVTISGETAFCEGGNTTLTASGAVTYSWGANDNTAELTVAEIGTYTVTGTDANGCENMASVEVTMNALPTVTISGETVFCEGGNTTLTATGAVTYSWGANDNMAELTVTEAGTHTVTGTDANGCENTASVEVTVNTLPTVTVSGETAFCEGGSTTLTATGAVTYTWGTETTAELTVTRAGTYTVTGTDANGCENTASVEVTVNALPTVAISGEAAFCEGGNTTLTATGAVTYSWGTETTAELTVAEAGTYTVTGTDANGCVNTATVEVTMNTLPTVAISGETAFCEGGNATLTASGAATYTWGTETTAELTVTEPATYTVTGTDANGCTNTASVEVTMNTLPTVTISGDTSFCFGGSTVLTASGAETYEWSTMEFGAEFEVAEAGTYTVIGTDSNGCTNMASQEVTVIVVNTEVEWFGTPEGTDSLVAIQENAEYQWIDCATNEPIEGATQSQFTPEVSGSYACVITVGECSDTSDCQEVTITGIAEHGTADLTLYPNPTTGIVNIRLTSETCSLNPEIQLFDIYGRRLQIMAVTAETIQVDLSRYATGVYLVKLVNDGKVVAVKKVVKE